MAKRKLSKKNRRAVQALKRLTKKGPVPFKPTLAQKKQSKQLTRDIVAALRDAGFKIRES